MYTKEDATVIVEAHIRWLEEVDRKTVADALKALFFHMGQAASTNAQETNDPPIPSRIGGNRPDGYEVTRWPEFIALAKRLGISLDLPWTAVEIRVAIDEIVKITQSYLADDIDQQRRKHVWENETTNVHNKEFRTFQPPTLRHPNMIVYKQRNIRVNGEDIVESLSSKDGHRDSNDQQVQWSSGSKTRKTVFCRSESVEDARRSVIQAWGLPIDVEIEDVTQPTTEGLRTEL